MKTANRVLLTMVMLAASAMVQAVDFDLLRSRLREHITLGAVDYDPAMPEMRAYLDYVSATADSYQHSMRKDTTWLWEDQSQLVGVKAFTPAHICESYRRLLAMAQAWAYPGNTLYHDSLLLADIRYGLSFLYQHAYNEGTRMIGNWWEWRIGVPWYYATTVSILYEQLSATELRQFERSTTAFIRSFMRNGDLTYANQASLCRNLLAIGILTNQQADVEAALQYCIPAICDETTPSQRLQANRRQDAAIRRQRPYNTVRYLAHKEGLYADGTFVQHTAIPYIGTYGSEIIAMVGYIARLIPGSGIEVPQKIMDVVPVWVNKAYLPAMYHGEMMLMFMGRANAGDPYFGARTVVLSIMDAALLIEDEAERNNALKSAANVLMNNPHYSKYAGLPSLPVYRSVMDRAAELADKEGRDVPFSLVLAAGDKAIHQTEKWRFCLSMSSNRIGKYECFMRATGNQNTTGWYGGDGMTYLYLPSAPKHYYQYFQNINPYRVPGTTVSTVAREEVESVQPLYGHQSAAADEARAGGVTLGTYSSAMMQLVGAPTDLRAKKSWFMFGDEVVCLGADIHQSDTSEVITCVENRRDAGQWKLLRPNLFYLNGVGAYYFPDTTEVQTNVSANGCAEMWLSHGKAPQSGSYSYVLLPLMPLSGAMAYASEPGVTILANTASQQAVYHAVSGVTALHFWQKGEVDVPTVPGLHVTSDGVAAVMISEEDNMLHLAIADPTWDRSKQVLTLSGHYSLLVDETDGLVSVSYKGKNTVVSIDQRRQLGVTQKLTLQRVQ